MRDDFKRKDKDTLAKRVGMRCSNPECRSLTSGPHTTEVKSINIGVAAHITAASSEGPRFDATLTSSQRKSINNGIWLCQSCAKLIDSDKKKYDENLLRQWKSEAEKEAERELVSPNCFGQADRNVTQANFSDHRVEGRPIRILVSCPTDLDKEKNEILSLGKLFTDSNINTSGITFHVLDYRNHVGCYGERPQEQLNIYFSDYDVYIGILWKRFGTKTGVCDSDGKEFESGTEEEFELAMERYRRCKKPLIYFFIKTFNNTPNSEEEKRQFNKVLDFIERQKQAKNNYLNFFHSSEEFKNKIFLLLNKIQRQAFYELSLAELTSIPVSAQEQIQFNKIRWFQDVEYYIRRTVTTCDKIAEQKINMLFGLQSQKQTLKELVLIKQRIVLLGDAGSGKTTELKMLCADLCKENQILIPIFTSLGSYLPENKIENFLPAFWNKVRASLLLIVFDGLDEIIPSHFHHVIKQLIHFSESNPEIRMLISIRTNFYDLYPEFSQGTLQGFEPYFLDDITFQQAKAYFEAKYPGSNADGFIEEVFKKNMSDLLRNAFFLLLLADVFSQDESLPISRGELYELFVNKLISADIEKYSATINLRSKRYEIFSLLQKIAIAMEMLCQKQISETKLLELISSDEYELLKYSSLINRREHNTTFWQFTDNNIQEFLAARIMKDLEYEQVLELITFSSEYHRLNPSWVNTLAFLFSTLDDNPDLKENLLEWLTKNEPESIIKFETERLEEPVRIRVFKEIFNHYKEHKLRIKSKKFNDSDLANFGQSEEILNFLLNEIQIEENTIPVKISAIEILEHFRIPSSSLAIRVKDVLFEQIDKNIAESYLLNCIIYALKNLKCFKTEIIHEIMHKIGWMKDQYVRAAVYSILYESKMADEYVGYLIEGCELRDKVIPGQRDKVNLMDENWNLNECLKSITSPCSIRTFIGHILKEAGFNWYYHSDVLDAFISNVIKAHCIDKDLFYLMLAWFMLEVRYTIDKDGKSLIRFFNQTGTRDAAFRELWTENTAKQDSKHRFGSALLFTKDHIELVINEYLGNKVSAEIIRSLYFDVHHYDDGLSRKLRLAVNNKTDLQIDEPVRPDYKEKRRTKDQESFDLLINPMELENALLSVFDGLEKDSVTYDDLVGYRIVDQEVYEWSDNYPDVALGLLREFVYGGREINRINIQEWFFDPANVDRYCAKELYRYLTNSSDVEVKNDHLRWINNWCEKYRDEVNFKEAIKKEENGLSSYSRIALRYWVFTRRFDIQQPKEIYLDMLSFDFYENNDYVGIDFLLDKLAAVDVISRMLSNLEEGISDSQVLRNHVKYLTKHKIAESYPYIIKEICNASREYYHRKNYIDHLCEIKTNIESLKKIIDIVDPRIRWDILELLKSDNQHAFVEKYLIRLIYGSNDQGEIFIAAQKLLKINNAKGLKVYRDCIVSSSPESMTHESVICLGSLTQIETVPILLDLLEYSYQKDVKVEKYEHLSSHILATLKNIGLISIENFQKVTTCLRDFLREKADINPDTKYIVLVIDDIEHQFYMKHGKIYSIKEVKTKLRQIEH